MAQRYSDIIAAKNSIDIRAKEIEGDRYNGNILHATCSYTCDGTEAAGDVIDLVDLPTQSQIITPLCFVSHDGTGATTLVFNVGDPAGPTSPSATKYASGITAAGGTQQSNQFQGGVTTVTRFRNTAQTRISATISAKTGTITAGKKIVFDIAYKCR